MRDSLRHRGPDSEGLWCDRDTPLWIGQRRLSILDLSEEGAQPMVSASGRYVIGYNGEVYNFRALRSELEERGARFRGTSDTEVVLAAIEEWGLFEALSRFNGMFAFSLWDLEERTLHLVRDRVGIKPLFFGWVGKTFVFASELKPFLNHPKFEREVDPDSLARFMRYGYVPDPFCIYKGLSKLPPASILSISAGQSEPTLTDYWSPFSAPTKGALDEEELTNELEQLLRDSVRARLVADVPVGAFLSGGIDSSLIVALAQEESSKPVRTFTIGFDESEFNEAEKASAVADALGTDHTALYFSPADLLKVVPELPTLYDEPFADASQLPTYLLAKLTRESVTVSLSGDGADELFCGYPRYWLTESVWRRLRPIPGSLRKALAAMASYPSADTWDGLYSFVKPLIPHNRRVNNFGFKIEALAQTLDATSLPQFYDRLMSHWMRPEAVVSNNATDVSAIQNRTGWQHGATDLQRIMNVDLQTYLPGDILTKLDRASMAVSLEARVPYLDHRVVELAVNLPLAVKLQRGRSKSILRALLARRLSPQLFERQKQGFSVPLMSWFRGPLRDWVEELLGDSTLVSCGLLEPEPIKEAWLAHIEGRRNREYQLWNLIVFLGWWKNQSPVEYLTKSPNAG